QRRSFQIQHCFIDSDPRPQPVYGDAVAGGCFGHISSDSMLISQSPALFLPAGGTYFCLHDVRACVPEDRACSTVDTTERAGELVFRPLSKRRLSPARNPNTNHCEA